MFEQKSSGKRIKFFRERAGLSQMDLELAIGASSGSLSRIERERGNPTKSTLINIVYATKLNTEEIASLFGIDINKLNCLDPILSVILSTLDLDTILDLVVNELVLKIGYIASAIFLLDHGNLYVRGLTASDISKKVFLHLDKPLDQLFFEIDSNKQNFLSKALEENRPILTHSSYKYLVPLVTKKVADKIQTATGDKSNLLYPLIIGKNKIGVIVYVKKVFDDFAEDMITLEAVTPKIAIAINNALKYKSITGKINYALT